MRPLLGGDGLGRRALFLGNPLVDQLAGGRALGVPGVSAEVHLEGDLRTGCVDNSDATGGLLGLVAREAALGVVSDGVFATAGCRC